MMLGFYLTDSRSSRVAYTEPLGRLTAEIRTPRRSAVEYNVTNDNVVLSFETSR